MYMCMSVQLWLTSVSEIDPHCLGIISSLFLCVGEQDLLEDGLGPPPPPTPTKNNNKILKKKKIGLKKVC